jgi:predicted nuclease of predicted toxin-antitoxin system
MTTSPEVNSDTSGKIQLKFKIDENLPQEVCALLQEASYDALSVLDQALGGADDPQVFQVCQKEQRVLVTLDVDFANIQAYPPQSTAGIIVLRLTRQDKPYVLNMIQNLLPILEQETPARTLWIVEEERIRIRR